MVEHFAASAQRQVSQAVSVGDLRTSVDSVQNDSIKSPSMTRLAVNQITTNRWSLEQDLRFYREEGFEAALIRKHSPASARKRIFDGASEAQLIALACCEPPKGRARWTLELLEGAVVERGIVARASDNTIGRTLKKMRSSPI